MNITFETERETDGRWIAEVPELAGVMAYGVSEGEAIAQHLLTTLGIQTDQLLSQAYIDLLEQAR